MKKNNADFYKRMQEAKALKKKALEQAQLHAEFLSYPERFVEPVIVKSEAEIKMDTAFLQLKEKLYRERGIQQERIQGAIRKIEEQSQGI